MTERKVFIETATRKKMRNCFGFGRREEQKSELEERFGIEFVDRRREPFPNEIGKPVTLATPSGALSGMYRGLTETGFAILFPSVVIEKNLEGEVERAILEEERPTYIRSDEIIGLAPRKPEYLDKLMLKRSKSVPEYQI